MIKLHAALIRTALIGLIALLGCKSAPKNQIVLHFWHGIESALNNNLLQKKVAEFESRNPHIKIELQNIGAQDKAMPKIMTAISTGHNPDILWYAPVYTGTIAQSGKLLTAEDFFDKNAFTPQNIYPGLLESGRYKGRIYTVPFETNCLAIYYNKSHFRGAQIKQIPRTWEELVQAAKKLTIDKNGDGEVDQYGFLIPLGTEEWTVWCWETFLWQADGRILSEDETLPEFHKLPGIQALQYWVDMVYKHNCAMFSSRNAGYKLDPFLSGKVSMMINGPWNFPLLKDQSLINYGSFPLPANKEKATNIGGENLYLFKSEPEKEQAAWDFAVYIMSADFQVDWAINTGYLPVSKKAASDKKYSKFLRQNPFVATYVESMEFGKSRPAVPQYSRISDRIGRAIEKALYRKMSPEDALKEAAEKVKELL